MQPLHRFPGTRHARPVAAQQQLGREAEGPARQALERADIDTEPLGKIDNHHQLGIEQRLSQRRDRRIERLSGGDQFRNVLLDQGQVGGATASKAGSASPSTIRSA